MNPLQLFSPFWLVCWRFIKQMLSTTSGSQEDAHRYRQYYSDCCGYRWDFSLGSYALVLRKIMLTLIFTHFCSRSENWCYRQSTVMLTTEFASTQRLVRIHTPLCIYTTIMQAYQRLCLIPTAMQTCMTAVSQSNDCERLHNSHIWTRESLKTWILLTGTSR